MNAPDDELLLIIGLGAALGVAWWWFNRQPAEESNSTSTMDAGASLLSVDTGMEAATDAVDDWINDNLGTRIMGNWINDLNTRGAPYKNALANAEAKYGIPDNLLARLAWQESRFRADIISGKTVSGAGALGIMQIVPRWHPSVDPLDPFAAIDYAGKFLSSLYRQFGSWELALKAYNWGAGNVKAWLAGSKSQPLETLNYSAQILSDIGGTIA